MKTEPSTVHLVDDDESFAKATARLLDLAGYAVRTYGSAEEFLQLAGEISGGCVLVDLHMPEFSGLDLQTALATTSKPPPMIFLTGNGDFPSSVSAIKGGAEDFLTKPVTRAELCGAIERALARGKVEGAKRQRRVELQRKFSQLTPRELEVLRYISAGLLNKEVADRMGTRERTVKAQRASIMEKLGASSPMELGRLTEEMGIMPLK